jgi:tetratricopeptide repeat protein
MNWQLTEFILKGIYLGLLVLVAMLGPAWSDIATIALCAAGGLVLCLGIAGYTKVREGYRIKGRLAGFILFLILENPGLVYTGLLLGLGLGAYAIFDRDKDNPYMMVPVLGGAALGLVFWFLRHVRDRRIRMWVGLGLAAMLVGGAVAFLHFDPEFMAGQRDMIGYLLLMGLPGFYLLTFAGTVEESEIEIAAMCAALGIGLWILGEKISPTFNSLALALPIALYFLYTRYILPGLRVFKHVLRGLSYARVGRYRPALLALSRAVTLNPENTLARETLWRVHQEMDYDQLANDPETLEVVNFELCLERAGWLLLQGKPAPEHIQEAQRLLNLVAGQRPALLPRCNYWRAVALTHQGRFDEAADALTSVVAALDDTPHRQVILFQAWQLALLLHPELKRRVGTPVLALPGRRLEAIAAVEGQLALRPDDPSAWDLKRLLYSELTEADYDGGVAPGKTADHFDYEYTHQLGLALIEDKDRWRRGCEYLRLAAYGLPARAPLLFLRLAQAHEKANDPAGALENYRRAKQAARAVGPANLSADDRQALFAAVKQRGEQAQAAGRLDDAIDDFKFYSQYERAGLETYRTLAELFEQKSKQAPHQAEEPLWLALNCTEHALTYDSKDKDLLARKDRYYYSVTPDQLRRRVDQVYKWFDVDYCKQKARWALERTNGDLDMLDWASHLSELAQIVEPASLSVKVLRARILRQRGEIEQTVALLEEIRNNKPEKFANAEEEEAWYLAHRLLGDLYVDERPDQAVLCLQEFRKSPKSGANTMFNLGRAYENLGDRVRAARCYEQVTAFEGNPLVHEAHDALDRLRQAMNP